MDRSTDEREVTRLEVYFKWFMTVCSRREKASAASRGIFQYLLGEYVLDWEREKAECRGVSMTLDDIVNHMAVSKSTASSSLKWLEENGIIKRVRGKVYLQEPPHNWICKEFGTRVLNFSSQSTKPSTKQKSAFITHAQDEAATGINTTTKVVFNPSESPTESGGNVDADKKALSSPARRKDNYDTARVRELIKSGIPILAAVKQARIEFTSNHSL